MTIDDASVRSRLAVPFGRQWAAAPTPEPVPPQSIPPGPPQPPILPSDHPGAADVPSTPWLDPLTAPPAPVQEPPTPNQAEPPLRTASLTTRLRLDG